MTAPDFKTFCQTLKDEGVNTETLVVDKKGTLFASFHHEAAPSTENLPVLMGDGADTFRVKGKLGSGGMGTIHLASQPVLERDVAVKQALKREGQQSVAAELLAEGIVTGQLEHPNIVPMYALGKNADGDVLLIMKRIDGTVWSDLLAQYPPTTPANLERHLRILIDVCEAIAFAHSKGVVHRDLKPQNVMVGSFGEVYVLDWGLALGFSDDAPKGAYRQSSLRGISGTPAYMAPEMTLPSGVIDGQTDIYLLGAVLFQLLTGRPPHERGDIMRGLYEAYLSKVNISEDVPNEIRSVCLKALSREKKDRYANAKELIAAIDGFLQHKAARELEEEAEKCLKAFYNAHRNHEGEEVLSRHFVEAQFGFEQVLRLWPESRNARAKLREGRILMARYQISLDRLDAAEMLLADIRSPPEDLLAAMQGLKEKRSKDAADLEAYREAVYEQDTAVGRRARAYFFFGVGVTWCALQFTLGFLSRAGLYENTMQKRLIGQVILLIATSAVIYWRRRYLFRNKSSAQIMWSFIIMISGLILHWSIAMRSDISFADSLAISHLYMAGITISVGTVERNYLPLGFSLLIGCLATFFPNYCLELNGIGIFIGISATVWLSSRSPIEYENPNPKG